MERPLNISSTFSSVYSNPYGMLLDGRHGQEETKYRYSFQGQETDDEIKGKGNSVNYKYRMHDPRIGRFFAIDPLASKYPHNSPYAFSENRVLDGVELEGLEWSPYDLKLNVQVKLKINILKHTNILNANWSISAVLHNGSYKNFEVGMSYKGGNRSEHKLALSGFAVTSLKLNYADYELSTFGFLNVDKSLLNFSLPNGLSGMLKDQNFKEQTFNLGLHIEINFSEYNNTKVSFAKNQSMVTNTKNKADINIEPGGKIFEMKTKLSPAERMEHVDFLRARRLSMENVSHKKVTPSLSNNGSFKLKFYMTYVPGANSTNSYLISDKKPFNLTTKVDNVLNRPINYINFGLPFGWNIKYRFNDTSKYLKKGVDYLNENF